MQVKAENYTVAKTVITHSAAQMNSVLHTGSILMKLITIAQSSVHNCNDKAVFISSSFDRLLLHSNDG